LLIRFYPIPINGAGNKKQVKDSIIYFIRAFVASSSLFFSSSIRALFHEIASLSSWLTNK